MGNLKYIKNKNGIEIVVHKNINIFYPKHTHTKHQIVGIITDGTIKIKLCKTDFILSKGQAFSISANTAHSIYPMSEFYTMITVCLPKNDTDAHRLDSLKKEIIQNPESELNIEYMSGKANISKFHLIRKFKEENGLTPHKFQIQCRIRKAQKLLENNTKVIDVAIMSGFFDQSHFCKTFKQHLGISPNEYRNCLKN